MDGAIILAADASRIARANVHLMPKATIPTSETGTRHRTAERVARSIDVPVLSASAAMSGTSLGTLSEGVGNPWPTCQLGWANMDDWPPEVPSLRNGQNHVVSPR